MEFLNKYLPINTEEKVLLLLQEIDTFNSIPMSKNDFINFISCQIRKKKLQELFREKISKVVQTTTFKKNTVPEIKDKKERIKSIINKTQSPKVSKAERKATERKKQQEAMELAHKQRMEKFKNRENQQHSISIASPSSIVGKNLIDASSNLCLPVSVFEKLLIKHKIELNKIFTEKDFNLLKVDINLLKNQTFDKKLEEASLTTLEKKQKRYNPSKGKEGNYFKLIYNHPKS